MEITLIFPHQLFKKNPAVKKGRQVFLLEHPLFFGVDHQYPMKMHWQKLLLHRASMQSYRDYLLGEGVEVDYWECEQQLLKKLFSIIARMKVNKVFVADSVDFVLQRRLKAQSKRIGVDLVVLETPCFINTNQRNRKILGGENKFFMHNFYQKQRQELKILIDKDGKPAGGQWSYDSENRKKMPQKIKESLPLVPLGRSKKLIKEAANYVKDKFSYLGVEEGLFYPVDFAEAEQWLEKFLKERFAQFGPYEDAIVEDENWLFHSVLTPALNIGLLTPQEVIDRTLKFAEKHEVAINSLEGFVRQIIGWREFMRGAYDQLGVEMRNGNYWQHHNQMPASFYSGETGIEPIDNVIKRILRTGYCHHIERLMVLGGLFFLLEIDPREIYRWFMEMFVDSYDWVMVPNVYAMSQNSCGGLITTKPYFSGSNYIRKMSDYQKGEWSEKWDALYWHFIAKNIKELKKNHRWRMICSLYEKFDSAKKRAITMKAEETMSELLVV